MNKLARLRDAIDAARQELYAAADGLDDEWEADETREIADELLLAFEEVVRE